MNYETTFYLTCPMCSSEICTGDTDEFLIVECMEEGCLYRCTRKAWPKDLVKGVSRGAPSLPSMVFTIHHKGVDYVKLEDYEALAKTIADGTKEIDAKEALRRLTVCAGHYMIGSCSGEGDVDKYFKIVSTALSSAERSARR